RAVKSGEEAVTRRVHFAAAEPSQLAPCESVVALQELAPPAVAQRGRPLRGAHDVGDEHCSQDAIGLRGVSRPRQKLLYLIQDHIHVDPGRVVATGNLDEARAGNMPRQVAALLDPDYGIASTVDNQRGYPNRG